jgi:hypothetical protein
VVAAPLAATAPHPPLRRHAQQHPISGQSQLVHAVPDGMAGAGRATRGPHEVLGCCGGQAATATRGGAACTAVDSRCQGGGLEGGGREGAWRHVQVWPAPGSSNISRWHGTRSAHNSRQNTRVPMCVWCSDGIVQRLLFTGLLDQFPAVDGNKHCMFVLHSQPLSCT